MSQWEDRLFEWLGHGLPIDYLAFDCETTGLSPTEDLPIDFGYAIMRDGVITNSGSWILDWTRRPDLVEPEWLADKLDYVAYQFKLQGKPYHYSLQRLREEGRDPVKVLSYALKLFDANRADAKAMFAGHNATAFDSAMLHSCFHEYLGSAWRFDDNDIFDTGCMEKALETARQYQNPSQWLLPNPGETMRSFFIRVKNARRAGVKWNIEACVERYELVQKRLVDPRKLHGAEADARVCCTLIEMHRKRRANYAKGAVGGRPGQPSVGVGVVRDRPRGAGRPKAKRARQRG